jgi:hypothetical protein
MTHEPHTRSDLGEEDEPEVGVGGSGDPVQEADEESFPASDPPSTWSGRDSGSTAP